MTLAMCANFSNMLSVQSAIEYSPEIDANRVISIDLHDISLEPYTLKAFLSQLILRSVTIVWICPLVAGFRQDSRIAGRSVVMAQRPGVLQLEQFLALSISA